jgi:NAD(P)-dependent dehydrogenase (short-subunit alcohol dehydrogenase family)
MNLELDGKLALVTGSTAGIGFAIAKRLVEEGASVIVNGRRDSSVSAAVERLKALGMKGSVQGAALDLGSAKGVEAIINMFPKVDVLVNNLGIFDPVPFESIDDAAWQHFFEVNVMSGVRLSRHYLPAMLAANWGRIVFISSESGICPPKEMIHYGMTKSAQLSISRGLAEVTAGTGVTVNSVLPGPTKTEGAVEFFTRLAQAQGISMDEVERQFFKEARPTSLLQRFTHPDEVAAMVAYVCSPLSSATNGAALRADGGVVRSIT